MSHRRLPMLVALAAVLMAPGLASAADQVIFGKKLLIKNPSSGAAGNKVVHLGKDPNITIGAAGGAGDPPVRRRGRRRHEQPPHSRVRWRGGHHYPATMCRMDDERGEQPLQVQGHDEHHVHHRAGEEWGAGEGHLQG
jgi:hypothetical protein